MGRELARKVRFHLGNSILTDARTAPFALWLHPDNKRYPNLRHFGIDARVCPLDAYNMTS